MHTFERHTRWVVEPRSTPGVGCNTACQKKQPLTNVHKCILLLVDSSKTHLTHGGLRKMQSLGVEVVVFPPRLTAVIQPLDKSVFRALKAIFRKKEEHWKRKNQHRAPTPADFVPFWTDSYIEAVTLRSIVSGFKSCGIASFDPNYFLNHCPPRMHSVPRRPSLP